MLNILLQTYPRCHCPERRQGGKRKDKMKGDNKAKYITWHGKTQCMSAWAREFGMSLPTFRLRYKRHNGDMEQISKPVKKQNKYYLEGRRVTVGEIARLNGRISINTADRLLVKGMPPEEVVHARMERVRKTLQNEGQGDKKPDGCTFPDCDNCPFDDDCKW